MKKGNCYQVTGNYIIENDVPQILLCHGIVSGQGKLIGLRIKHAWIEIGDIVLDYSNGNKIVIRKEKYYKIGKIKEEKVKKYTRQKAIKLFMKYKTYGGFKNVKKLI